MELDTGAAEHEKSERFVELLEKENLYRLQQAEIDRLKSLIVPAGGSPTKGFHSKDTTRSNRRETWAPGAFIRKGLRPSGSPGAALS